MAAESGSGAGLGVGAVARRLGVAASTLRTWDRRYGIGPSGRSAGGHRRYTADDLARLEAMQRLIVSGAPPAEAARAALDAPPAGPASPRGHGAGGNRIPLDATPAARSGPHAARVRGLARAAMALDERAMTTTVHAALDREGVVAAWELLFVPVLVGIGRKHAASGAHVEVEHLLSAVLLSALTERARPRGTGGRSVPPVLLACAPEEQHCLPVYALAAALAEAGTAATVLGARVPVPALTAAIDRTGPPAAFVWSQTSETGDPSWLAGLPTGRPPLRTVIGGPGWADRIPPRVRLVTTLSWAVAELQAVTPRR
ncbi:MerR family transcriptional regulator [Actinomadura sediminis]|uniref:MerR family transcriptional regulator n=1 Tax=Actinomadura sediminis TaxID=1038904 RepID=A0ABW3EVG3_9ACTN